VRQQTSFVCLVCKFHKSFRVTFESFIDSSSSCVRIQINDSFTLKVVNPMPNMVTKLFCVLILPAIITTVIAMDIFTFFKQHTTEFETCAIELIEFGEYHLIDVLYFPSIRLKIVGDGANVRDLKDEQETGKYFWLRKYMLKRNEMWKSSKQLCQFAFFVHPHSRSQIEIYISLDNLYIHRVPTSRDAKQGVHFLLFLSGNYKATRANKVKDTEFEVFFKPQGVEIILRKPFPCSMISTLALKPREFNDPNNSLVSLLGVMHDDLIRVACAFQCVANIPSTHGTGKIHIRYVGCEYYKKIVPYYPVPDSPNHHQSFYGIKSIMGDVMGVFGSSCNSSIGANYSYDGGHSRTMEVTVNHAYRVSTSYEHTYSHLKLHHKFITCTQPPRYLSFAEYVNMFSVGFWVWAISTFSGLCITAQCVLLWYQLPDSMLWIVVCILFEQGISTVGIERKTSAVHFVVAALLLSCLVLTNTYRSARTTDLTARIPGGKIKTLREALDGGFNVVLHAENGSYYSALEDLIRLRKIMGVDAHNPGGVVDNFDGSFLYSSMGVITLQRMRDYTGDNETKKELTEVIRHLTSRGFSATSPLDELYRCNGTVVVGDNLEIDHLWLQGVSAGKSELYLGRQEFMDVQLYLHLHETNFDRTDLIHRRISSLIHTGVFNKDITNSRQALTLEMVRNRKERSEFVPLSIESNIITSALALHCILISLILLIFLGEILFKNHKDVIRLESLRSCCRMLRLSNLKGYASTLFLCRVCNLNDLYVGQFLRAIASAWITVVSNLFSEIGIWVQKRSRIWA